MATFDDMQRWVTLGGVIIAAGASSLNLWRQFSEETDKIKVGFGPIRPQIEPGYWLYVVSQRQHQMVLRDYGFIDESGNLLSVPQLFEDEPFDTNLVSSGGASFDKRGSLFEIGGVDLRDNQIGAFAVTAGQNRYTVGFRYDVPWYKRFRIKLQVRWMPSYQ